MLGHYYFWTDGDPRGRETLKTLPHRAHRAFSLERPWHSANRRDLTHVAEQGRMTRRCLIESDRMEGTTVPQGNIGSIKRLMIEKLRCRPARLCLVLVAAIRRCAGAQKRARPLGAGTLSAPPHLKLEQATEIAIV
jgi:hypothetical protein